MKVSLNIFFNIVTINNHFIESSWRTDKCLISSTKTRINDGLNMLLIRSHFKNEFNYQYPRTIISESSFALKNLIIPNWMVTLADFPYFLKRIQDYRINTGTIYIILLLILILL